jgi:mannose-6-phosphate isomerase-like protein (cupin superfamily)
MVRTREPEAREQLHYDQALAMMAELRDRQYTRKVVIRDEDRPWEQSRQGYAKHIMDPLIDDTALTDWWMFVHEIKRHSGKHRHQGGLVIYVLEGKGYTVCDSVRYDWEAGDLIVLPLKPGGIEHQHFNTDDSQSAKWIAFIYVPYWFGAASELIQIENSPDFGRTQEAAAG